MFESGSSSLLLLYRMFNVGLLVRFSQRSLSGMLVFLPIMLVGLAHLSVAQARLAQVVEVSSRTSEIRSISALVNLTNYPIDLLPIDLESDDEHVFAAEASIELVEEARSALKETGVASFPDFLTTEALKLAADEAVNSSPQSFVTDNKHNAWQTSYNESLPSSHLCVCQPSRVLCPINAAFTCASYLAYGSSNLFMRTRVSSVAFDQIGPTLRALYESEELLAFVSALTQRRLFRLADPLGACSINVFREGWDHAWHFDESEYTVTLSLQQAERGGDFLFTPPLRRSADELALDAVASVIRARTKHTFEEPPPRSTVAESSRDTETLPALPVVRTAPFRPGTLQVFAGRYSLHAVTRTSGARERLVAVLCFATEPNVRNSPAVQQMFWGRSVE